MRALWSDRPNCSHNLKKLNVSGAFLNVSEVSTRGWRVEGVGARRSLLRQRFRPLRGALFPMPAIGEGEHNSGHQFSLYFGPRSSPTPGPANPFSKHLNVGLLRTLSAQRLKEINLAWTFQSRLKISISIDIFDLDLQNFPQKIGSWWVARLKESISLENFKILNIFNLWALREPWGRKARGTHFRIVSSTLGPVADQSLPNGRLIPITTGADAESFT